MRARYRSAALGVVVLAGTISTTSGAQRVLPALADEVAVTVDTANPGAEISPWIRGINGDLDVDQMVDAGVDLVTWGGNPNSRYNYMIGHAWNTAADWEFRNVNYELSEGHAFRNYAADNEAAGAATVLAVPTLGWIAKDDVLDHCSFPDGQGGCQWANWNCQSPGPIADPAATSIESTPEMVAEWVAGLVADGVAVEFIALDNEPDLWGHTHYDVHPECPTWDEVLDMYVEYSRALREVAPDAQLLGPMICCWFDFWNPEFGRTDQDEDDFLAWFLREVRAADEQFGARTLDVLTVHYYPQSDIYNEDVSEETSARRLRSTRSLWDPEYTDESWIDEPIALVPRLHETVAEEYPDTPIAITEWNFGADATMNGALAIADVLGIFGREGVYAAAYWRSPLPGSPGYFAMKLHGNYDDAGSAFDGAVVPATTTDVDTLSVFAALGDDGRLRVMLINKNPDSAVSVDLDLGDFAGASGRQFTYGPADLNSIVADDVVAGDNITVDPYTVTLLELDSPRPG